jgi:hypothetical protein
MAEIESKVIRFYREIQTHLVSRMKQIKIRVRQHKLSITQFSMKISKNGQSDRRRIILKKIECKNHTKNTTIDDEKS